MLMLMYLYLYFKLLLHCKFFLFFLGFASIIAAASAYEISY